MTEQGTFDTLEPIEKAGIDELRNLQLQRLKWSLEHAYTNVECYRKKFDEDGIHPSDLKEPGDLSKFPLTNKSDFRDNYPFGMFAVPMDDIVRIHASSGTTGKPVVVAYTRNDIDIWRRVVARSIRAAGGNHKDKIHVAYGYGLFTGGLGAHYGGELMGCTMIPMSGGQTEKQALLIRDFDPDIIMVTPSYMLNIADELERQGVNCRKLRLRVGIFGAEPWTDSMRANLEQRLDIDAVDIYGLSEVMGPGVAQECVETKDGPHHLGGPLLPGNHRPADGRGIAGWRGGRTGVYQSYQGGPTRDSLPDAGPDTAVAGNRAHHAPHGKGNRPQ